MIVAGALVASGISAHAGPVQLLSTRESSLPLPAGGNGDSVAPRISGNGRFIVFSSTAGDLVTNDNNRFALDVFLHDRQANFTRLASVNSSGTGGGNGDSVLGQVSAYGRYVVFQSDASDLLPGDTNEVSDIFVRDLFTGTTRLISVAANGGFANGDSTEPVMTPDGSCVAFISAATNLVAGDANGIPDVFVRDLITQSTWLISVGATGSSFIPKPYMSSLAITPDGRHVAFESNVKNLAAGVLAAPFGDVYVRDRLMGTTIWASTNMVPLFYATLGSYGPFISYHPALSDDGRYIAFKAGRTNGVVAAGSPLAVSIIFLHDTLNRTTTIVSTNGFAPWTSCEDVYGPEMSSDGRFLVYAERESPTSSTNPGVVLWDRLTGTNLLVSADQSGLWPSNTQSHTPVLSLDGRCVMFLSDATNLVGNVVSNGLHIYRRDLQTSTTVLVDADTNGIGSTDQLGAIPSLSADGQCAVFSMPDGGLAGSDANKALDVFFWDSNTNELISARHPLVVPRSGNAVSSLGPISLTGDGQLAAFASFASDLAANDFNQEADVFVFDRSGNSNLLVSAGLDGSPGLGGGSHSPLVSADGHYVIFASGATNLVVDDTNAAVDIFRREMLTGAIDWVSPITSGSLPRYDCSLPASSQDGRYIAFRCQTNTSFLLLNVYWSDIDTGSTWLVSKAAHPGRPLSLSADGQRLAYFDNTARLLVWDANSQSNIYTNSTPLLTSAAISPTGDRILYQTQSQLFVCDLAGGLDVPLYPSTVQIKSPSQWSGDGRHVAFVTGTSLVGADLNGTNDVYLRDLETGTLTLVSLNAWRTGSAGGASDWPAVSADGRFVAFRSFATDILPGIVNPPSLIVFDRLTGSNSVLVTGTAGSAWPARVARPAFSGDGSSLAFQSWDSGLVNGDLNLAGDVFAASLSVPPDSDSDADGIPDWWMNQHFGHPTGQEGDLSRAQDDADGDGLNNGDEYLAGTIPTNPASALILRLAVAGTGTDGLLTWEATPGRSYQVLSTTNLSETAWQVYPGSAGVVGSQGYLDVPVTNAPRYFRILCGD